MVLPCPAPVINPPGLAENGLDACSLNVPSGDLDVYTPSA